MRRPTQKVSIRIPMYQFLRLQVRADGNEEPLSDLLRRYIDVGDVKDTRAEQKTAATTGTDTP